VKRIAIPAAIAALLCLALTPATLHAKAKAQPSAAPSAAPSASASVAKESTYPFHGKVSAVDVKASTFTLEGKTPRVFNVTATTKIMKNGAVATLKDAVVGDDCGGKVTKDATGKLTALSVRFGPKPVKGGASPAPSPSPKK